MTQSISGKFDVRLQPLTDEFGEVHKIPARMSIDKHFHGPLKASSKGQMISCRTDNPQSAGYVAIEQVKGSLEGKTGSFVLQHYGMMDNGTKSLTIEVVPDSATEQLKGLRGNMTIEINGNEHRYQLDYYFV